MKNKFNFFITFLKIVFSFGIIYWLLSAGKLDLSLVLKTFNHPFILFISLCLLLIQIFIGVWRWQLMLFTQSKKIPYLSVLSAQWISLFFMTALPGGMAWDLAKITYIRKLDPLISKRFLVMSIFMDRLLGLSSLLFVAGLFSLVFYKDLIQINTEFNYLILINILFLAASILIVVICCLNTNIQNKILQFIPSEKFKNYFQSIWILSAHKKQILLAFGAGIIAHLLSILAFWSVNLYFFEHRVELKELFSLVPIGFVSMAIPLSPSGLGVGHAVFDKLFHFIGHTNGASLFNVFWVCTVLVNIMGVIPFIFCREKS